MIFIRYLFFKYTFSQLYTELLSNNLLIIYNCLSLKQFLVLKRIVHHYKTLSGFIYDIFFRITFFLIKHETVKPQRLPTSWKCFTLQTMMPIENHSFSKNVTRQPRKLRNNYCILGNALITNLLNPSRIGYS